MLPRWISWLFIAFMGYLIYLGTRGEPLPLTPEPPVAAQQMPAEAAQKTLADYPHLQQFANGNRWKRAMNPAYVGDVKTIDLSPGTGAPAQCGRLVTVRLRGTLGNGANFDPAHDEKQPLQFSLGNAPYPVLNEALMGMQAGGARQVTAPPQRVYVKNAPKTLDDVLLRVEMDTVESPEADVTRLGTIITQDRQGSGDAALCGEPISVALKLWNAQGKLVFETAQPITLTLGKDSVPYGLSDGLDGLSMGEIRTLVVPPSDVQKMSKALPEAIRTSLTGDAITILTVERKK